MSDFMEDFMDDDAFVDPTPPHMRRRVEANRKNAQHSTGPKTELGRAHSSYNALRHGLYAHEVVFPDEDREAYNALLDSLTHDFKPVGKVEMELIRRAADIWWRLGRTAAIEAGYLNPNWSGDPRKERFATSGGPLVDGFRVVLDDSSTLDRLGRYESRLERALSRTFNLLQRIQDVRQRNAREQAEKERVAQGSKNCSIEK